MRERFIVYGGRKIGYLLLRKKVKNINIRIKPGPKIFVSAADKVSVEDVEKVLMMKAPWLMRSMDRLARVEAASRRSYISGEMIDYLGSSYRLQVETAQGSERFLLEGDRARLFTLDEHDYKRKEQIVEAWYIKRARELLGGLLREVYPLVEGAGIKLPTLTVRKMKTRWGSCSFQRGRITLNSELAKCPRPCIEYVVLHELAHFTHFGHDSGFYSFLEERMPDWRQRKKRLQDLGAKLLFCN